jgi:TPR repeat protein
MRLSFLLAAFFAMAALAQSPPPRLTLTQRGIAAKNPAEAVKWFRKAAEQNDALAEYYLGNHYFAGIGVSQNVAEAYKWYRKAADQNLAEGQCNVGICYEYGYGVPKNAVEACKWYQKAAEQNDPLAQYNLGNHYASGEGVPQDKVEAYKWLALAAAQQQAQAMDALQVISPQLSADQLANAQRLVQEFKSVGRPPHSMASAFPSDLASEPNNKSVTSPLPAPIQEFWIEESPTPAPTPLHPK